MPPKLPIPRRRSEPATLYRRNALRRLEERWRVEGDDSLFDPSVEPTVTSILRAADGGIESVLDALRAHSEDDARTFVDLYDSLSKRDQSNLKLEEIAYACGIGSLRLVEVATSGMILYGQTAAKLMIASSMHKVTKAIVKSATDEQPILGRDNEIVGYTNGDTRAMEIFGKMSGLVPVPKGAQIAIQNNVAAPEKNDEPEAPYLDAGERLRLISDAVDPKRLPSPVTSPLDLGSRLTHMQDDVAEVLSGDL